MDLLDNFKEMEARRSKRDLLVLVCIVLVGAFSAGCGGDNEVEVKGSRVGTFESTVQLPAGGHSRHPHTDGAEPKP